MSGRYDLRRAIAGRRREPRGALRRILAEPAVHFVALGTALFVARGGLNGLAATHAAELGPREEIVVSADDVRHLRDRFVERNGSPPTPAQLAALARGAADEEMLYREARRLGLQRGDSAVRRRLVQKMRAVRDDATRDDDALYEEALALGLDEDDLVRRLLIRKIQILLGRDPDAAPPSEADLARYLERHRDDFLQPATITFSHVFVARRASEAETLREAASRRERLVASAAGDPGAGWRSAGGSGAEAAAASDPFSVGLRLADRSRDAVAGRFGAAFADRVFTLPTGRWSEPIASPYGMHLVRLEARREPRALPVDAVRRQVASGVLQERAAMRVAAATERLRALYEIRIEAPGLALARAGAVEVQQ